MAISCSIFTCTSPLTHWGRYKMADISQTTFLNAFSWMKIHQFRLTSLKFVSEGRINNIPSLVQIMAWRRIGDKPLSEPRMETLLTHICVTRPEWVNLLRPRQQGRHFPDDILKCIFLNENTWISIKISLKFVPKGPINNIPALVQIMAWRRPGPKPLSVPMITDAYMRHSVSMS